jgi:uncharacterized protein
MPDRPLPHPTALSAPFWQALADDRFVLLKCEDCGHFVHPPRHLCGRCHGSSLHWQPVARTGTLYSYTVVHRAPSPAFAAEVPYAVGLADVDGTDTRVMSNVLGDPAAVTVGMPVEVVTERRTDEIGLFFLRPGSGAAR